MPKAAKRLSWRKYKYINSVVSHNEFVKCTNQNMLKENISVNDPSISTSYRTNNFVSLPINVSDSFDAIDDLPDFIDDLSDAMSDSTNYSSSSEVYETGKDFRSKLSSWAVAENIHQSSLNKLLSILRKQPCHSYLPSTARTLLKTPRQVQLFSLAGGTCYHFGILKMV